MLPVRMTRMSISPERITMLSVSPGAATLPSSSVIGWPWLMVPM